MAMEKGKLFSYSGSLHLGSNKLRAAEADAHREEEFRLLYVAVSRAQCAVHLLSRWGGDPGVSTTTIRGKDYAWRDEVLRAQAAVTAAGGRYSVI